LGLGQAEKEVGLVLGQVRRALQNPALANRIVLVYRVVAGGDTAGANAAGGLEQLVKLEVVVAERTRDRSSASQIFLDERPNNIVLKTLLLIDDVIRDPEVFGHAPRVVDIVEGTAATSLRSVRDAMLAGQASLIPKLKRQPDHRLALMSEHCGYCRGVNPSGHGYGNGFELGHRETLFCCGMASAGSNPQETNVKGQNPIDLNGSLAAPNRPKNHPGEGYGQLTRT
jgi:hypothetical protein